MWRKKIRETDPATERIFNTILTHAIHDAARDVCIEVRERKPHDAPNLEQVLGVSFLCIAEWKETMTMAATLQPRVLAHIRRRAAMRKAQPSGAFMVDLRDEVSGASLLSFHVAVEIASDKMTHLHLSGRDADGNSL